MSTEITLKLDKEMERTLQRIADANNASIIEVLQDAVAFRWWIYEQHIQGKNLYCGRSPLFSSFVKTNMEY